ncbi:hypothetical protein AAG906_031357 [Vitis piasezkii]|uniref:RRM domain-containing protein n=2 Tax=Vitis vinifera TaxID=29760 RepID=D7FBB4_VITVI|eukprot:XP_002274983.1 PREDICTED: glycine-rich RNA-binding protein 4, mitochondrial isoform X1 [Vitis vinifera]
MSWHQHCVSVHSNPSLTISWNKKAFNLRASLFDHPLASRIMVTNLSYATSKSSLQEEFSKFGQIVEVDVVKDKAAKRPRGYAFIQYTSQDHAMLALENMDHKYLDGRVVCVELAKPGKNDFGRYPRTCGPPSKKEDETRE